MATAIEMIAAHWPEHVDHTVRFGPASMDQGAGVLCGCGEVLGWPVEEPPEEDEPDPTPLELQRPKSARGREAFDKAAAAVAAARAKATPRTDDYAAEGPKTGAYGTYERKEEPVTEPTPDIVDAEVVEDNPRERLGEFGAVHEDIPVRVHAGGMVGDQTAKEWQADQVAAGHGPAPEVLTDLGVADEAQAMTPPMTEEELAVNLGIAPESEKELAEHPSIWCDAMVPDGQESMDQCSDRTGPESPDFLCNQHADYSGSGASGQYYENGKVVPLDAPAAAAPAEGKALAVTGPEPGSGTPILPVDPDSQDPVMGFLPPLDPTQVYTPKDVEIGILEILRKLQNGDYFLREQLSRLHKADYALMMKYELKVSTSNARAQDQRKAEARIACAREIYEQTEADMLVRATRDSLHSLRSQLMGLQTVARSLGVSIGGPSYGP